VYGHKHEAGGSHSKFQLRNHQQDETTPPVLMPKIRSWVQSEADEEPPFGRCPLVLSEKILVSPIPIYFFLL